MYLLDTNIVSQRPNPRPNPLVIDWLRRTSAYDMRISVITIQEVRFGAERLPKGKRRTEIEKWIEKELIRGFSDRILPVDVGVANTCGRLLADMKRKRYTPGANDALIAATALFHGLKVVTLNRQDFKPLGVDLVTF